MLYLLYENICGAKSGGMFEGPVFRASLAIIFSFLIVLLSGGRVIRWLMKQKVGDLPEFHNATLNELTKNKKNTPTMGGIIIISAILVTVLLLADIRSKFVLMGLFCMVYLAALGGIDDWLKLRQKWRPAGSRDGLFAWEKMLFQVALGVMLSIFVYRISPGQGGGLKSETVAHLLNWPFLRDLSLPIWAFGVLTVLVITGTSNAVNLTDGMDGLAAGCMVVVAMSFMVLAQITGDPAWAIRFGFICMPQTSELAVLCGAIAGACLGFLWYNCNPAQVFMGDTGSLALGGTIGYIAVVIRQEPMLLLIGGIFVFEATSVMMQVTYFRLTGGKRIFLCSPIHHHFHLKGWSEQQVVVRFWLISVLFAACGLATIKLR